MVIKELQLLSEGLWESVKTDLKFFSSIQTFVRKLSEFDFTELNEESIKELVFYSEKIEEFFDRYRSTGDDFYIPPNQTSSNDQNVKQILQLTTKLKGLSPDSLKEVQNKIKPIPKAKSKGGGKIFIGHGRSKLWARLQVFLKDEMELKTLSFESESRTSESIINVLNGFLDNSSLAILVLTAEDETAEGNSRARQNVIHEAGLFQGRLGFDKVVILKQEGIEEFSNIAGLQYIPFSNDNIEQTFYELQRKFKKLGMIK